MAWYDDLYNTAKKTYNYVTGYAESAYDYLTEGAESVYDTAYDRVSGFLGVEDGARAAPGYRPSSLSATRTYYDPAAEAIARQNVAMQTFSGVSAYADYDPGSPSWLQSAWGATKRGVSTAQEMYGAFTESPLGKAVDVFAEGYGKGQANIQPIPVSRVSAPGVAGGGSFRATAVDLRSGFADPRISNAMQKALSSEVPQVQLVLQSINPNKRTGAATIGVGSASVSAPKIRKLKSKTVSDV